MSILPASSQLNENLFLYSPSLDSAHVGEVRLNVGGLLFFRDNEFSTSVMDGYTLPGFRFKPTVSYMPSQWVKAEVGLNLLRFWGTDQYPNMAYRDIATWTGDETTPGFHIVPFFRVQMATNFGLQIILGNIYGAAYHRLITPLHEPELNLTTDPEAGAQILYTNRWLDADLWVNWESFIYKDDFHQEEFVFGLSTRFKYNKEQSRIHVYTPVQLLAQHRGGEIDTIRTHSVQTLMNGTVGLGATWNFRHKKLHRVTLEANLLGYYQQAGTLWPFNSGSALYFHGNLDFGYTRLKGGYFIADKFISMFGYPLFGCVSTKNPGMTYDKPSTIYVGFDYGKEFAPGFSLGLSADLYYRTPCHSITAEGTRENAKGNTSFSAGIYMRINPSFVLYKKK